METTWKPSLEDIAHTLEKLDFCEPKPAALKTLHWLLEKGSAARGMWEELTKMRPEGVSLYELAKLVAVLETGGAAPESQPVMVWLLNQAPEAQEQWQQLRQLCEDMIVDPTVSQHPLSALQRYRDLERLLALDYWRDPSDLLDPGRDRGYHYEELLALTDAQLMREKEGSRRERLIMIRSRIALYTEKNRNIETLDEKLERLQLWRQQEGKGLTAAELEEAASLLRLAESADAPS